MIKNICDRIMCRKITTKNKDLLEELVKLKKIKEYSFTNKINFFKKEITFNGIFIKLNDEIKIDINLDFDAQLSFEYKNNCSVIPCRDIISSGNDIMEEFKNFICNIEEK